MGLKLIQKIEVEQLQQALSQGNNLVNIYFQNNNHEQYSGDGDPLHMMEKILEGLPDGRRLQEVVRLAVKAALRTHKTYVSAAKYLGADRGTIQRNNRGESGTFGKRCGPALIGNGEAPEGGNI